jgi:hypothetical protein
MAARIEARTEQPDQQARQETRTASSEPRAQHQSAAALAARHPDEIELVRAV